MSFADDLATMADLVHGGAIASLVDTAAMAASWSTEKVPDNLRGTTADLSLSFLSGARGSELRAEARVLRRGRTLCFCEVEVSDGAGEAVAKSLVTYKLG
jgi:uncharacterized protein (TIGR00369 family)